MKMNSSFKWVAWVLALLVLASSCTAFMLSMMGGGGGGGGTATGTPDFAYSFDANDELLLTGTTATGDLMSIFGTKKKDGTPTGLTGFEVIPNGDTAPTVFSVVNNAIKQVIAPNGVVMDFDWQSSTAVLVSLFDPNTNERLNTYIDENTTKALVEDTPAQPACRQPLPGGSFIYEGTLPEPQEQPAQNQVATKGDGNNPEITGKVVTTNCGEPYMATNPGVFIYEANYFQKCIAKYPASYNALGYFEYILPAGDQPHNTISLASVGQYLDGLLGKLCVISSAAGGTDYIQQVVCPGISVTIAGLGMGSSTPAAAAFLAACTAAVTGLNIYCNTWGASPDGDWNGQSPSEVKDKVYETLHKLDIEWDTPLYIEPRIQTLNGSIKGERILYKGGSSIPVSYMSSGDTPKVYTIYLTPNYPKAGQSYSIEAIIKCALEGSVVTISVKGTDSYADEKKFTVKKGAQEASFKMDVPGGDKGVRDEIIVTIDSPDGKHDGLVTHLSFGAV